MIVEQVGTQSEGDYHKNKMPLLVTPAPVSPLTDGISIDQSNENKRSATMTVGSRPALLRRSKSDSPSPSSSYRSSSSSSTCSSFVGFPRSFNHSSSIIPPPRIHPEETMLVVGGEGGERRRTIKREQNVNNHDATRWSCNNTSNDSDDGEKEEVSSPTMSSPSSCTFGSTASLGAGATTTRHNTYRHKSTSEECEDLYLDGMNVTAKPPQPIKKQSEEISLSDAREERLEDEEAGEGGEEGKGMLMSQDRGGVNSRHIVHTEEPDNDKNDYDILASIEQMEKELKSMLSSDLSSPFASPMSQHESHTKSPPYTINKNKNKDNKKSKMMMQRKVHPSGIDTKNQNKLVMKEQSGFLTNKETRMVASFKKTVAPPPPLSSPAVITTVVSSNNIGENKVKNTVGRRDQKDNCSYENDTTLHGSHNSTGDTTDTTSCSTISGGIGGWVVNNNNDNAKYREKRNPKIIDRDDNNDNDNASYDKRKMKMMTMIYSKESLETLSFQSRHQAAAFHPKDQPGRQRHHHHHQQQEQQYEDTFKRQNDSLITTTATAAKSHVSITNNYNKNKDKSDSNKKKNVFETLPKQLVRTGLLQQACTILRDEKFVLNRIRASGVVQGAEFHVADCAYLHRQTQRRRRRRHGRSTRRRRMTTTRGGIIGNDTFEDGQEQDQQDCVSIPPGFHCGMSVSSITTVGSCATGIMTMNPRHDMTTTIMTEEDWKEMTLEACRVYGQCIVSNACSSSSSSSSSLLFSPTDSGQALTILTKFLHGREWIDDAIQFSACCVGLFCGLTTTSATTTSNPSSALQHLLLLLGMLESRPGDDQCVREDCDTIVTAAASLSEAKDGTLDHVQVAEVLNIMGDCHGKKGNLHHALRAHRTALAHLKHALHLSVVEHTHPPPPVHAAHTATATLSSSSSKTTTSSSFSSEIEINIARTLNRIGTVYGALGNLDSALVSYHRALDIRNSCLGPTHLDVGETLHNIGVVYRHEEKNDAAMDCYQSALRILRLNLGNSTTTNNDSDNDDGNNKTQLSIARTLHNMGGIHRRRGEFDEAMQCYREVLQIRRERLGDYHPSVSLTLISIGALLRKSGRKDEAKMFYDEATR